MAILLEGNENEIYLSEYLACLSSCRDNVIVWKETGWLAKKQKKDS